MRERDLSFDYLKGILIYLVILGHSLVFVENVIPIYDPLWKSIHSFHMPLFVLISGYFFRNPIDIPFQSLLKKQFLRLLLPQFSFVLLGLLIIPIDWERFSYLIAVNGAVNIKPLYHFITFAWFLWCIFFCSLYINTATRLFKSKMPIVVIGSCIIMYLFYDYLPGPVFKNQQFSLQLAFFFIGMCFRKYNAQFKENTLAILLVSVLVICAYMPSLLSSSVEMPSFHSKYILMLATVPVAYYLIKRAYTITICKDVIVRWGQNSLGLYVIHVFLMRFVFYPYNFKLYDNNIMEGLVSQYAICCLISFVACEVIMLIVKLLKSRKLTKLLFLGEK